MPTTRREYLERSSAVIGTASVISTVGCLQNQEEERNRDQVTLRASAAGGGFDAYARLLSPYLSGYLPGEPDITVENIPRLGDIGAVTETYNSDPNGTNISLNTLSNGTLHQIGRDTSYDLREMSHIGALSRSPNGLIIMGETGVSNWDEFVNNIENINIATGGAGTISQIWPVALGEITGEFTLDEMNFVHYDGTGEVIPGLEQGEAGAFMPGDVTSGAKIVESFDSAKFLIVLSEPDIIDWYLEELGIEPIHYSSELDIENIDEVANVAGVERSFCGPPDMPDDTLSDYRNAFSELIDDDEYLTETKESGRPVVNPGDSDDMKQHLNDYHELFNQEPYQSLINETISG